MMHAMDVRRDDNLRENAFDDRRQANVGVMKLHDREQQAFVNDEFGESNPKQENQRHTNQCGQRDLPKMEPRGRSDIEKTFRVMNSMKAPKKRYAVIEPVPGVHPAIENEQPKQKTRPL